MSYLQAILFFTICLKINAVPPEACSAAFRWDDCGSPPVHVIYYWKPGSRCEVGIWRGCLPNLNMFKDEYECAATCIFTLRAEAEDYHVLGAVENLDNLTITDSKENTYPIQNVTEHNVIPSGVTFDDTTTDTTNTEGTETQNI
ncbi:unnamed protein product [Euphydryas editha]|uniref:BPTI/Kunitz inhibitor domain-containing protein n=1 Tax=Euphydryas editha TaxID=104508 RepID=A0AAU9UYF4_EUPED|nr:unnamed protein product [Euphydryas editha]